MSAIVRKILFPCPTPPDYSAESFPDDLIWVENKYSGESEKTFIPCAFLPSKGAKRLVIYCHGNGCDLGTIHSELVRYRNFWKVHVLAMEYPGYGICPGTPSEKSINLSMLSVYHYITKQLRWPSLFIFFYGRSIGTGPVCKLVADLHQRDIRVGGIILQCAYTSIRDVVSHVAGSVAAALISNRWCNIKEVTKIDCPVLLIHGQADELIPFTHSEDLYDRCKSQHKQLVIIAEASHNVFDEEEDIMKPIMIFVQRAALLMQKTIIHFAEERRKKLDDDLRRKEKEGEKPDKRKSQTKSRRSHNIGRNVVLRVSKKESKRRRGANSRACSSLGSLSQEGDSSEDESRDGDFVLVKNEKINEKKKNRVQNRDTGSSRPKSRTSCFSFMGGTSEKAKKQRPKNMPNHRIRSTCPTNPSTTPPSPPVTPSSSSVKPSSPSFKLSSQHLRHGRL